MKSYITKTRFVLKDWFCFYIVFSSVMVVDGGDGGCGGGDGDISGYDG